MQTRTHTASTLCMGYQPTTVYGKQKAELLKLIRSYCYHVYKVHLNSQFKGKEERTEKAWFLVKLFDAQFEYKSLIDICAQVLRIKGKLEEIMINPANASYEETRKKLDRIFEIVNQNFLFKQ